MSDTVDVTSDPDNPLYIQAARYPLHVSIAGEKFLSLPAQKPYLINIAYIECVVGEWNKDRTQYGVRIFLRSGNSVWTADGVKVLKKLYGDDAVDVFEEVAAEGDEETTKKKGE